MRFIESINEIRQFVKMSRSQGKTIGFVPTMGYMHQGHLALMRQAREECDLVVVSIFVNPMQFGPSEDFSRYPRDMERDLELSRQEGVSAVFVPRVEEIYPPGFNTRVEVEGPTGCLCDLSRPGHFTGVATVVTKLFNIVLPDRAFFGQKDAQQTLVIKKMVQDLNMPLEIVVCPTFRESDGLAMSSRNVYLSPEERTQAPVLYQSLLWARDQVARGERDALYLVKRVKEMIIAQTSATVDYVEIRSVPGLEPVQVLEADSLMALAVRFSGARLIDNIELRII